MEEPIKENGKLNVVTHAVDRERPGAGLSGPHSESEAILGWLHGEFKTRLNQSTNQQEITTITVYIEGA